jgi:hypothetical protein
MRLVIAALVLLAACGDNLAPDPCRATECPLPAPPRCDGTTLVVTADATCTPVDGVADCEYAETRTDCAASGKKCFAGACFAPGSSCLGTSCDTPPTDTCNGDTAIRYDALGSCDDSSGAAVCSYAKHETDCTATQKICHQGACVEACSTVSCTSPPPATCNGTVLTAYPATGTCDASSGTPTCSYPPTVTDCATFGGLCANGACVPPTDPCAGVTCDTPPADTCTGSTRHHYPAAGTCDGSSGTAQCVYTPADTDCAATDQACSGGACVDPCVGFACTTPPASDCTNGVFTSHASPGTCSAPGGVPACTYAPTMIDCKAMDEACDPARGCVDPCAGFACTTPPPPSCAGTTLTTYASPGACSAPGGVPGCTYTPTTTDCAMTGDVCANGACVPPTDPCAGVTCNTPPADDCTGSTQHHYPAIGTCSSSSGSAVCAYPPIDTDCAASNQACSAGACVDPCVGFTCATPPAAACDGNVAKTYTASGTCSSPGGVPGCTYAETDDACSPGRLCLNAACTTPTLFCRVQFPASITDVPGTVETVYGRIYVSGVTDQSGVDDPNPNVRVQLGLGTGADPSAYTYTDAVPNAGYGPSSPSYEANNDEYQGTFTIPDAPGTTESYAYRLSADAGATWLYCDTGDAGSSDGFTQPGTLTIAAPFFSEYVEGMAVSSNKAVEIYNPGQRRSRSPAARSTSTRTAR